jgi:hypothetical protein
MDMQQLFNNWALPSCSMGLSASTVKTHLRRLFAKTGTDRQADPVKLVGWLRQSPAGVIGARPTAIFDSLHQRLPRAQGAGERAPQYQGFSSSFCTRQLEVSAA